MAVPPGSSSLLDSESSSSRPPGWRSWLSIHRTLPRMAQLAEHPSNPSHGPRVRARLRVRARVPRTSTLSLRHAAPAPSCPSTSA
eukprot:1589774-Rhodomonas_salina.1